MCDTKIDETLEFRPRFNDKGLIMAVVSEVGTGQPLMVAYMNEQALDLTLETGEAHFYSRSRQELWHKGGTSGNVLRVAEMRTDCDQDVIWLTAKAEGHGAACHTGRKSCFYRILTNTNGSKILTMDESQPLFDPKEIYS